jgi:hypothetical protein
MMNQAKEGSQNIAKDGSQSKSNPRLPAKYTRPPARVKAEYAPRAITQYMTVPFGTDTYSRRIGPA